MHQRRPLIFSPSDFSNLDRMTVQPNAASSVSALLQNAADLLDSLSARLSEMPMQALLLPPRPEGADFDEAAAVRHRVAHTALCLAEMLFFLLAVAFLKRFFDLDVTGGQRNLLFERHEENNDPKQRTMAVKTARSCSRRDCEDDDNDDNDDRESVASYRATSVHDESWPELSASCVCSSEVPAEEFPPRPMSPTPPKTKRWGYQSDQSSSSSSSADPFETSRDSSHHSYNSPREGRDCWAEEDEEEDNDLLHFTLRGRAQKGREPGRPQLLTEELPPPPPRDSDAEEEDVASTVPTSGDDNAVLTFDSNHLAASSQYDRSDCGDDDEEPTSFFDNDPVTVSNKRKRSDGDNEFVVGLDVGEDADARARSLDSELSWFREHYGRVWDAEDPDSDSSEASSASSR